MGLKGTLRTPDEAVRTRRNTDNLAARVEFIDPGGGITLNEAGALEIVTGDGIQTGANGLTLVLNDDPGLSLDAGGLAILLASDPGLTIDATGLAVLLASDPGLELTATGLRALVAGVLQRTASGVEVNLGHGVQNDGGALAFDRDAVMAFNETPSGSANGVNDTFVLANEPTPGTVRVFLNGVFMTPGEDYTLQSTNQIVFEPDQIPQTGDQVTAHYLKEPD